MKKKEKSATSNTTTRQKGGSFHGRSRDERSDSDAIDRMADLKVSNPLFVGASKMTNHSFIRHLKAESQCHPKTPFHGTVKKRIFFPQDDLIGNGKSGRKLSDIADESD